MVRYKKGVFTDPRDSKQYKTVKIGEQTWLAENLNWKGTGVWYNNSPILGNAFGRLYTWKEALKAAPPGWHLPTDEEWQKLVNFAGGDRVAGEKLRAKDGWQGNGTDEFGFSALPGGFCLRGGIFYDVCNSGDWWCATGESPFAFERNMNNGDAGVYRDTQYEIYSFSVRLVKD